ncbi:MAG: hypothetical protein SFW67_27820 [Myxococcaceae bacterium]|nr:hypothetical protein [Myxococcaceae bacterium]
MKRSWPLVLTVMVGLPSLTTGFVLDDWMQRAVARGQLTFTGPLELFSFGSGRAEDMAPLIHRGPFPWFTQPDLKLRFLRPLSSALIWFDTTVFGDAPVPQHLHSLAWALALTAVAMALYQRLLPPPLVVLAGVCFAVDDAHALPTMWLANRNALVASALTFFALALHLRWRSGGPGWFAVGAVAFAALGLSAGETAVACLAYVAAYELVGRAEPLRHRLLALAPMTVLLGVYGVVYKLTASGARGSATYVDPVSEPLVFLAVAPVRLLANVGAQTWGLPDLWLTLPPTRVVLVVAGVLSLPAWWFAWRRWAPAAPEERRTLSWLGAGAALSVVPTLATFPAARLLTAASLGLAALVAAFLKAAWQERGLRRVVGLGWLVGSFGVGAVLAWLSMPLAFRAVGERTTAAVSALGLGGGERVVVVSSTEFAAAIYGVPVLLEQRRPEPTSWHVWSMAQKAIEVTRVTEREVELRVVDGVMLESVFEQNFRGPAHPVPDGYAVALDGQPVTVVETRDGFPVRVRIELQLPAEAFTFVWWNGDVLERLDLPEVGQRRVLPRSPTVFERLLTGA